MSNETVLVLGDLVIPVGAGRGISQTLEPISNGDVRRTVNGELIDLTRIENRKFQSQIQATDMESPTFAELWKGQTLLVECIKRLYQRLIAPATAITLIRDPVVSSIIGRDVNGDIVATDTVGGIGNRDITFLGNVKYVEWRPILNMMVLQTSGDRDEYGAEESWQIDLEEV